MGKREGKEAGSTLQSQSGSKGRKYITKHGNMIMECVLIHKSDRNWGSGKGEGLLGRSKNF